MEAQEPLIAMAVSHKHMGFQEEAEVRIAYAPVNKEDESQLSEAERKAKKFNEYYFNNRNGLLVPYIPLFKEEKPRLERENKLPITKIIIGPHSDGLRRQKSVIKLLKKYGIRAEVTVSEIPYIGK